MNLNKKTMHNLRRLLTSKVFLIAVFLLFVVFSYFMFGKDSVICAKVRYFVSDSLALVGYRLKKIPSKITLPSFLRKEEPSTKGQPVSYIISESGQEKEEGPQVKGAVLGEDDDEKPIYFQYLPVPSISNFSTSPQTASAALSYSIETPPGPGGLKPNVGLSYSSAQVDNLMQFIGTSKKHYFARQSGPVGLGWGISGGDYSIIIDTHGEIENKLGGNPDKSKWTFHLKGPMGAAELIKVDANGNKVSRSNKSKWENGRWATDPELFIKVLEGPKGKNKYDWFSKDSRWRIKTGDGTEYIFQGIAKSYAKLWCLENTGCDGGCDIRGEERVIGWNLKTVKTSLGQEINYSYERFRGRVGTGGPTDGCYGEAYYVGRTAIKSVKYGPHEIIFNYGQRREDWRMIRETDFEEEDGKYTFEDQNSLGSHENNNAYASATDKALSEVLVKTDGKLVKKYKLNYYDNFTVKDEVARDKDVKGLSTVKDVYAGSGNCGSTRGCPPDYPIAAECTGWDCISSCCRKAAKVCCKDDGNGNCDRSRTTTVWPGCITDCCANDKECEGNSCVTPGDNGDGDNGGDGDNCNSLCEDLGPGWESGWCNDTLTGCPHHLSDGDQYCDEDDPYCCCSKHEAGESLGFKVYGTYNLNGNVKSYHLHLKSIQEFGKDGSTSLPAQTFTYQKIPYKVWWDGGDTAGSNTVSDYALNSVYIKTANNGYGGKVTYEFEDLQQPVTLRYSDGASKLDSKNDNITRNGKKVRFSLQRAKLKRTMTHNGMGEWWQKDYVYPGDSYGGIGYLRENPRRYEYLGYSAVSTAAGDKNTDLAWGFPYHPDNILSASKSFFHQGVSSSGCFRKDPRAGLVYKSWVLDGSGKVFSETLKDYKFSSSNSCESARPGQIPLQVQKKSASTNSSNPFSPANSSQTLYNNHCRSNNCARTMSRTQYDWDFGQTAVWNRDHGNFAAVTKEIDYGDADLEGDETTKCMRYTRQISADNWILRKPRASWIQDGHREGCPMHVGNDPTMYKATQFYYDGRNSVPGSIPVSNPKGLVTKTETIETDSGEKFASFKEYDQYGNVIKQTDARGNSSYVRYYPGGIYSKETENALGHKTVTEYDFTLGVPTKVINPNGAETQYSYDSLGRLKAVAKPGDNLDNPTSEFSYLVNQWITNAPLAVYKRVKAAKKKALPPPPNGQITITAKGENCEGWPHMKVYANDSLIGEVDVSSAEYSDYNFSVDFPVEKLTVVFNNDYSVWSGENPCDRNLYVEQVVVGEVVKPSESGVSYDRGDPFDGMDVISGQEGLWWDGGLHFYFGKEFLEEYDFYNGIGQKFETQSLMPDDEKRVSEDTITLVNGVNFKDSLGRAYRSYLPFYESSNFFGKARTGQRDGSGKPVPEFGVEVGYGTTDYDLRGRVYKSTTPDGEETKQLFREADFLSAFVDAEGSVVVDKREGRVNKSIACREKNGQICSESEGLVSASHQDVLGNTVKVVNSQGVVISEGGYDSLGRKKWMESLDRGGRYEFMYDPNGNVVREKSPADGMDKITVFKHDALDRVTKRYFGDSPGNNWNNPDWDYESSLEERISYRYDDCVNGKGRRCEVEDRYQEKSYSYDMRGQLDSVSKSFAGKDIDELFGSTPFTTNYEYDNIGRTVAITYAGTDAFGPETVNFEYEGPYLRKVHGDDVYVDTLTYNKFGQVTTRILGNDVGEFFNYDGLNQQLENIFVSKDEVPSWSSHSRLKPPDPESQTILDLHYSQYSPTGNILEIKDNQDDYPWFDPSFSMTQEFSYDEFYRLTEVSGSYNANYRYDDVDRMEYKGVDGESTSFTFDDSFPYHGIKEVDGDVVEYDEAGHILSYKVGGRLYENISWDYDVGKPRFIRQVFFPPICDISISPSSGYKPLEVVLDGSDSLDPDGEIVKYEWKCREEDNWVSTEKDSTYEDCTFNEDGKYTSYLRVTDDSGHTNVCSSETTVFPSEPPGPLPPEQSGDCHKLCREEGFYWGFCGGEKFCEDYPRCDSLSNECRYDCAEVGEADCKVEYGERYDCYCIKKEECNCDQGEECTESGCEVLPEPLNCLSPVEDAYTDEQNKRKNFGQSDILKAGAQGSKFYLSYLKFDESDFPADYSQALLRLYQEGSGGAAGGLPVYAHRVTSSWDEDELTWRNQPDYDESEEGGFVNVGGWTGKGWKAWDVTPLLGEGVDDGFLLREYRYYPDCGSSPSCRAGASRMGKLTSGEAQEKTPELCFYEETRPVETSAFLYCPFDDETECRAGGERAPVEEKEISFAPGRTGKGIVLKEGSSLSYSSQDNIDPQKGTVMFWLKPVWSSKDQRKHPFFSYGENLNIFFDKEFKVELGLNDPYISLSAQSNHEAGEMIHLGLTYNLLEEEYKLYLDGNQMDVSTGSLSQSNYENLDVGTGEKGAAEGVMDDLKIFNRVLTEEEICLEAGGEWDGDNCLIKKDCISLREFLKLFFETFFNWLADLFSNISDWFDDLLKFLNVFQLAYDARCRWEIKSLSTPLESYFVSNGHYPKSSQTSFDGKVTEGNRFEETICKNEAKRCPTAPLGRSNVKYEDYQYVSAEDGKEAAVWIDSVRHEDYFITYLTSCGQIVTSKIEPKEGNIADCNIFQEASLKAEESVEEEVDLIEARYEDLLFDDSPWSKLQDKRICALWESGNYGLRLPEIKLPDIGFGKKRAECKGKSLLSCRSFFGIFERCFVEETYDEQYLCNPKEVKINKDFSSQSVVDQNAMGINTTKVYTFTSKESIYGVTFSGGIQFKNENSLVRVLLIGKSGEEKLIYESYPLLAGSRSFSVNGECEETCTLPSFEPKRIEVQTVNAQVNVKNITYASSPTVGAQNLQEELFSQRVRSKIKTMNKNLEEKEMLWRAGETSISNLSYEEKNSLFVGAALPNLQGYEYYIGGVFELKSSDDSSVDIQSSTPSLLTREWDWRGRHGSTEKGTPYYDPDISTAPTFSAPRGEGQSGWLTSIKDQKFCGSCWAFSTLGVTESLVDLYYNKHVNLDLSEQNLVSCCRSCWSGDGGCDGGYNRRAIDYLINEGVVNEECFPYSGSEEGCDLCSGSYTIVKVSGKERFNPEHENKEDLKRMLIEKGPLVGRVDSWWHFMVLVGYKDLRAGDVMYDGSNEEGERTRITIQEGDPRIGKTAWLFKNSKNYNWGYTPTHTDWPWGGGYGYLIVDDIGELDWTYAIETPLSVRKAPMFRVPDYAEIECRDEDEDGFCNWGISGNMPIESLPDSCPETCIGPEYNEIPIPPTGFSSIRDCDDSDPSVGPYNLTEPSASGQPKIYDCLPHPDTLRP